MNVKSYETATQIVDLAKLNRNEEATIMNPKSSRSHAIFLQKLTNAITAQQSTLFLVDLAGSERIKKSDVSGDRRDEAIAINTSQSTLGKCINGLADKSTHVPFRESKLTKILHEAFGGNCQTTLIVTLSPELNDLEETISSLMFGQRARRVQCKPLQAKEGDMKSINSELRAQLEKKSHQLITLMNENAKLSSQQVKSEQQCNMIKVGMENGKNQGHSVLAMQAHSDKENRNGVNQLRSTHKKSSKKCGLGPINDDKGHDSFELEEMKTKYEKKMKIMKEEYEKKMMELDNVMLIQEKEIEKQKGKVFELEEKVHSIEILEDQQQNIEMNNEIYESRDLDSEKMSIMSPLNQFGDKLTERLAIMENEKKNYETKCKKLEQERQDYEEEKERFECEKAIFEEMRHDLSDDIQIFEKEKSVFANDRNQFLGERSLYEKQYQSCTDRYNNLNVNDKILDSDRTGYDYHDKSEIINEKERMDELKAEIIIEKQDNIRFHEFQKNFDQDLKNEKERLDKKKAKLEIKAKEVDCSQEELEEKWAMFKAENSAFDEAKNWLEDEKIKLETDKEKIMEEWEELKVEREDMVKSNQKVEEELEMKAQEFDKELWKKRDELEDEYKTLKQTQLQVIL